MKKTFFVSLVVALASLAATPASAQLSGGVISVRDSSTGAVVLNIGDTANNAMRINCITGCSGGAVATFGSADPGQRHRGRLQRRH